MPVLVLIYYSYGILCFALPCRQSCSWGFLLPCDQEGRTRKLYKLPLKNDFGAVQKLAAPLGVRLREKHFTAHHHRSTSWAASFSTPALVGRQLLEWVHKIVSDFKNWTRWGIRKHNNEMYIISVLNNTAGLFCLKKSPFNPVVNLFQLILVTK